MAWTTDALIANIKRRAAVPTAQNTYQNADFLDLIRDELFTYIVPMVCELRENFYFYDVDFTIASYSGVYDIPTRAVGAKIVNMRLIAGDREEDIDWIDDDSIDNVEGFPNGDIGAWIKRNQLITVPRTVTGWTTLRMSVLLRPGEPVLASSADVITGISGSVVTGTTIPSTWSTSNTFELIQANPHFDSLGIALSASAVSTGASGTVTLSTAPSSRLAVGDYIALNGQSPIVQAPEVCFPLLSLLFGHNY